MPVGSGFETVPALLSTTIALGGGAYVLVPYLQSNSMLSACEQGWKCHQASFSSLVCRNVFLGSRKAHGQ